MPQLLDELDAYLDAAPRPDSTPVDVGPFTLFVSRGLWPYYARPTLGRRDPISSADLDVLAQACREHGVGLGIEWVHEVHPELAEVAAGHGLAVASHALMVVTEDELTVPQAEEAAVRVLEPSDAAHLAGRAVAHVAFGAGGTALGPQGTTEREEKLAGESAEMMAYLRSRAERGLTVTAVAESPSEGVLAVGSCQPVGAFAEVVGVATLPAARRRGLAGAVTGALARDAFARGVHTVLLSAADDDVARVYGRLGFRRVGTAMAAEPAAQ